MKKKIYFIFELKIKTVLAYIFRPKKIIFYNKTSPFLSKVLPKKKFKYIEILSDKIKDNRGMITWTKVNYEEFFLLKKKFIEKNQYLEALNNNTKNFIIKANLNGLHYYDYDGFWRNIYFLNIFEEISKNFDEQNNFYFITDDFDNYEIFFEYSKKFNIKPIRLPTFNFFYRRKNYIVTLIKLLLLSFSPSLKKNILNKSLKPNVSLLYNGNKNLSDFSYYNDLLFTKDLANRNFNTTFLFYNRTYKFNKQMDMLFDKKYNFYFIENLLVSDHKLSDIKLSFDKKFLYFFLYLFIIKKKKYEIKLYNLYVYYFKKIFLLSKTKIFLDWNRHYFHSQAIYESLDSINSIYIIYSRSYFNAPTPLITTNADLCLTFGDQLEIEKKTNSKYKYLVIVGSYYYLKNNEILERSKKIRNNYFKKNTKNIICYLDENTIAKKEFFDGHHVLKDDLKLLFSMLDKDSSLGLILKPKVMFNFYSRIGELKNKINHYINDKRLYLFDDIDKKSLVSEAALASDFVIHCSVHASTAAIESALQGVRTIILNTNNYLDLSNLSLKKNINYVDTLDDFINCWDKYLSNNKSSNFGLWDNETLNKIDPFRDGDAYKRIGELVNDLSLKLEESNSKDTSIEYAINKYKLKWGNDKVVKF